MHGAMGQILPLPVAPRINPLEPHGEFGLFGIGRGSVSRVVHSIGDRDVAVQLDPDRTEIAGEIGLFNTVFRKHCCTAYFANRFSSAGSSKRMFFALSGTSSLQNTCLNYCTLTALGLSTGRAPGFQSTNTRQVVRLCIAIRDGLCIAADPSCSGCPGIGTKGNYYLFSIT